MPAYKDKKTGTWTVKVYYKDWTGENRRKTKRGFETKKAADEWEVDFKARAAGDLSMLLSDFVDLYYQDKAATLKERTFYNKRKMIGKHILPVLGNKRMCEITPAEVLQWQTRIQGMGYERTYIRNLQNQLRGLFAHAVRYYGLREDPTRRAQRIGKSDSAHEMHFWTEDEFRQVIDKIPDGHRHKVIFQVLYWTGLREGELLALTPADIDLSEGIISVTRTWFRKEGIEYITEPKTETSIREVDIPKFLCDILERYIEAENIGKVERLFPIGDVAVQHAIRKWAQKAGVKRIRVHDLRHSHAAWLIDQGVDPYVIQRRLGHKDIRMTLNTYGHLYPDRQRQVSELIENRKDSERRPAVRFRDYSKSGGNMDIDRAAENPQDLQGQIVSAS